MTTTSQEKFGMNRVTGGVTRFDAIAYCWSLALHSLARSAFQRFFGDLEAA